MRICTDASVLLSWVLPQIKSIEFDSAFEDLVRVNEACAPELLFPECTANIRRQVHKRLISHNEASQCLRRLLDLPVTIIRSQSVYESALDIANELGHARAYDAQYLAAARQANARLLTSDGGMHSNARRLGIEATLLQ